MKEYVVTFKTSCQISPDDWDVYSPALKVNENTTVKEIEEFYRKHVKVGIMEVRLSDLETSTGLNNSKR